jgi:hypothetical protein
MVSFCREMPCPSGSIEVDRTASYATFDIAARPSKKRNTLQLAKVVAVISIIGHFYQYFKHKTEENAGISDALKQLLKALQPTSQCRPTPGRAR